MSIRTYQKDGQTYVEGTVTSEELNILTRSIVTDLREMAAPSGRPFRCPTCGTPGVNR